MNRFLDAIILRRSDEQMASIDFGAERKGSAKRPDKCVTPVAIRQRTRFRSRQLRALAIAARVFLELDLLTAAQRCFVALAPSMRESLRAAWIRRHGRWPLGVR